VSDQDLNFNPPPRREAKKAFEPPPWERDQFDELARRQEADQAAASETAEEDAITAALDDATAKASEGAALELPTAMEPTGPVGAGGRSARKAVWTGGVLDPEEDPRVEAMLQVLKSEEPEFGKQLWKVSLAAGAVVASVGLVMTVWGIFAISATSRAGALGSLGGGILLAFGLGFVGLGGWMAFRTLRQRGVL
jgi:hypothetical protein